MFVGYKYNFMFEKRNTTARFDEYIKAMETVRQRNMMNREMKFARVHGYYQSSSLSMIVYKRFAVRRYEYGGSGIVDTVGSLLARYATKALLATAAKATLRGGLDAAKRAVPHLLAHKLVTTIGKKRKRMWLLVNSPSRRKLL